MPFKPALVAAIVVVSLAALGTGTAWGASTGITSGPSGTIATDSVVFTFDSPHDAGFECSFDGADWSSCTSPKSYSGLAPGPHVFEVRAVSEEGGPDPTPAVAIFEVEAPALPQIAPLALLVDPGQPKPVAGETLNLEPVQGVITLICPGEDEYSRLTEFKQIPVGCLVNARKGIVDLTASKGSSGQLQGGRFWGGVFIASQKKGDEKAVDLKLAGKRMCERRGGPRKPPAQMSRAGKGGRKLWGSGKGNFKTSGSYGSATVSGTTWLVVDRCDSSTLIKVKEGTVTVRDFVKGKSVKVTEGEQYVAKGPLARLNSKRWP
jgi:hypothetical protein